MRKLKKVIVHCSASDDKQADDVEVIRKWHLLRGWNDIGYHFFIDKAGSVHMGRDIAVQGAHCKGHNADSIGICISGENDFQPDQFLALGMLLQSIFDAHGAMPVYPHNAFTNLKTCPNFDSAVFDKLTKTANIIS